eukprot:CAMPEP_0184861930 /NCGR_PEP_ID=MMETSP0580-20130426/6508_1 /TAXON_ID=1118495 /ORGANISM="Dactyliosolen fragilissimus" /LENGTH=544 /DNA_ID=CAMNT_0027359611 /DNA_START=300 /DNA_END=1931 /DNA_ORIENTATION=-
MIYNNGKWSIFQQQNKVVRPPPHYNSLRIFSSKEQERIGDEKSFDRLQQGSQNSKLSSLYTKLPRLYVGPYPIISHHSFNRHSYVQKSLSRTPPPPPLKERSKVYLTADQSRYLTKVMRYLRENVPNRKKRRQKKYQDDDADDSADDDSAESQTKDEDELIRIFDGFSGEWLARVSFSNENEYNSSHADDDSHDNVDRGEYYLKKKSNISSGFKSSRNIKKRKKIQSTRSNGGGRGIVVAECIVLLRDQDTLEQFQERTFHHHNMPLVAFAPIKRRRASILVEKCTELNCGAFLPIITDRTDGASISACFPNSVNDIHDGSKGNNGVYDDDDDLSNVGMEFLYNVNKGHNGRKEVGIDKLIMTAIGASEQSERLDVPAFLTGNESKSYGNDNSLQDKYTLDQFLEDWISNYEQQLESKDNSAGDLMDYSDIDNLSSSSFGNNEYGSLLICRERKKNDLTVMPILSALDELSKIEEGINKNRKTLTPHITFLIGPEGGWSPREELLFDTYCAQYPSHVIRGVSLGSMVMRAETAAIVAVTAYSLW